MAKTLVIYCSRNGTTKRYAEWIAADLSADVMSEKESRGASLDKYTTLVFGSPVYNDRIIGIRYIDRFLRNATLNKNIVLFIVQLVSTKNFDYSGRVISENIGPELGNQSSLFYLRGAIDWSRVPKLQQLYVRTMIKLVPGQHWIDRPGFEADTASIFVERKNVDFVDRASIEPIVKYVKLVETHSQPK